MSFSFQKSLYGRKQVKNIRDVRRVKQRREAWTARPIFQKNILTIDAIIGNPSHEFFGGSKINSIP